MKPIFFGIRYLTKYWFLGNMNPLICGIVLHNRCNLRCRHCTIVDRPSSELKFEEAVKVMDVFYAEGGRCLYLEGGEPFIWQDDSHSMEDIVQYAKRKGYVAVIIYTNGTRALESAADTIFVSFDGLADIHDAIRGKSFDRIMNNIRKSGHPSIYINFTINAINKEGIEDFCKYMSNVTQVNGTFFYFHTPYYGYDELYIDQAAKTEILTKLITLKRKYNILNSVAGLKSAIRNDWKKNLDICRVYENGKYFTCCRENDNVKLCNVCGYLSYAEIDQTLKFKPGAIINALRYF